MSMTPSHAAPSLHPGHYYHRAQGPLASLFFLLPFMALYEVGAWLVNTNPDTGQAEHVLARSFLEKTLGHLPYLPGLAVVVVLLAWHTVRRDRFEFDWRLYVAMAAESVVLAIPLLMMGMVWSDGPAWMLAGNGVGEPGWQASLVFAIGAGVYEELLFRLLAITLLHLVLVDVIGAKPIIGGVVAVACSALLFASYHFVGRVEFSTLHFTFYAAAGVYLGAIFALRGFGIVAATHAFYDVYYVAITHGLGVGD